MLLDSGLTEPSAYYAALLERARDAGQVGRYCWWDRPGYAWSSSGVLPQTAQKSAENWWEVVEKAGERGPFVVVGRGYGGEFNIFDSLLVLCYFYFFDMTKFNFGRR